VNHTPSGERTHIALFGKRNAGKSSLVNAITGQNLSIVSPIKGTTTDPVYKAMELLPLGPVQFIDTPGIDDEGELGQLRIKKTLQVLDKTDIALLVLDAGQSFSAEEQALISQINEKNIPYILVYNKSDLLTEVPELQENAIWVSAKSGANINKLKEMIANMLQNSVTQPLVSDLLTENDTVVLVVPIDSAAPKGRLILPQQQVIRDILDSNATAFVCKENALTQTLEQLKKPPRMVITDSQVFAQVNKNVPSNIPLTSFSILMARYKGDLATVVSGAATINKIQTGDKILIAEGCTHHRQCNDIGTVKIPNLIRKHIGVEPDFHFCSGTEFPEDLTDYKFVIHCGGCMLNAKEMKHRLHCCQNEQIPVTNYGILIAYLNGILKRTIEPFADIKNLLE